MHSFVIIYIRNKQVLLLFILAISLTTLQPSASDQAAMTTTPMTPAQTSTTTQPTTTTPTATTIPTTTITHTTVPALILTTPVSTAGRVNPTTTLTHDSFHTTPFSDTGTEPASAQSSSDKTKKDPFSNDLKILLSVLVFIIVIVSIIGGFLYQCRRLKIQSYRYVCTQSPPTVCKLWFTQNYYFSSKSIENRYWQL